MIFRDDDAPTDSGGPYGTPGPNPGGWYFAGGGAAGQTQNGVQNEGGAGGGGDSYTNGTANTGGGGGGGNGPGSPDTGGTGADGIVLIAYDWSA